MSAHAIAWALIAVNTVLVIVNGVLLRRLRALITRLTKHNGTWLNAKDRELQSILSRTKQI